MNRQFWNFALKRSLMHEAYCEKTKHCSFKRNSQINDMEVFHVKVGHFGGVCNREVLRGPHYIHSGLKKDIFLIAYCQNGSCVLSFYLTR